jgi:lysophospholipase L1-like esterase
MTPVPGGGTRRVLPVAIALVCAIGTTAATSATAFAKSASAAKVAAKHKARPKKKATPKKKNKKTMPAAVALRRGTTYIALGDSVTFGYQEPQVTPTPDYLNAASFIGYPEMLGSELKLKVVNLACPGETSASLVDNTSPLGYVCESPAPGSSTPGYRQAYPLHVNYTGSQLSYTTSYLRSHKNVSLISLMIGANDFFRCEATTSDHCQSLSEQGQVIGEVAGNVRTILSTLRNKDRYRGQLVIVNYYSLDYANSLDNLQSAAINQAVDNAAAPYKVRVANGFAEWENAAAKSGGNSCTAGLLTQLTGAKTPCGIHPTYAGQALLAQAVAKVLTIN